MEKIYRLAMAIIRVRIGNATEEERELLVAWLDESEANRQAYKRIIRGDSIREQWAVTDSVHMVTDYDALGRRLALRLLENRRRRRIKTWGTVAAVVCMGIFASILWLTDNVAEEKVKLVKQTAVDAKVKLVLASGEEIDLEEESAGCLEAGMPAKVDEEGRLVYERRVDVMPTEVFNKVITSVGGDYMLQLEDGTRVWLNAMSELEYPVQFVRGERVVRLSGEAYFEVARDTARPFIVEVGAIRTRVLGTSFNIQAYGNEQTVHATLVSGKVQVETSGESVVLVPGTEALWAKRAGRLSVRKVDVEHVLAWREGFFIFEEEDIEVVMRMLERWYGVDFVFDGGRRELHTFSGRLGKDDNLATVLEMITLAGGPAFRQEGRVVHVIEK